MKWEIINENDLKLNESWPSKISGLSVWNIINRNLEIYEPASNTVDHYWIQMQN